MEEPPSISSLVEKAVKSGHFNVQPKRRRDRATREAELKARQTLNSYNASDDSDFDDYCISDYVWNKRYQHEDEEYDQLIFNLSRLDKIEGQDRKVNVTTAICVRDCPEKAEDIAMWAKYVKPVLSKAPKKRKPVDEEKARRDAELHKILAEAAEEMAEHADTEENESDDQGEGPSRVKRKRTSKKK